MEAFKFLLFLLAALTSFGCMVLLFRGYARTGVDIVIWPTQVDLRLYRLVAALIGVACLLYAFIWEAE